MYTSSAKDDDGPEVEVVDGPFAGFSGVLVSREDHRVQVRLTVLARPTVVDLHPGQVRERGTAGAVPHDDLRDRIVAEHDLLAETEEFGFFLARIDEPDADLPAEWDACQAHREQIRARAERRRRTALDRYERELAVLSPDEARDAINRDEDLRRAGVRRLTRPVPPP